MSKGYVHFNFIFSLEAIKQLRLIVQVEDKHHVLNPITSESDCV